MRFNLRVTYNDGVTADVVAVTTDLVAFEDEFHRPITRFFEELSLKEVCWLAWAVLTRESRTAATFAEWLIAVDEAELTDGEVTPLPLEPAAAPLSESPASQ